MHDLIREEMREQGNLLSDQLQLFVLIFSSQHQVRISPDFPPKDRLEPILPGIGTSNRNAGSMEFEVDPATVGENVLEMRQEIPTLPHHFGFLMPKLELPVFEGQKPQWWLSCCEKLFGIHQVVDNQRVALASA